MDPALIERALKDADKLLEILYAFSNEDYQSDKNAAREQITAALIELRKVPTYEPAADEVEAAVNAFRADRENLGLPTYISKSSWRNHIQAALTAAALWRKEHGERVPVDKVKRRPFVYNEQPELVETETTNDK